MPSRTAQYRRWVFTLNNYSNGEVEDLRKIIGAKVRFVAFGFEIGEEGTPHLQGYIEFMAGVRLNGVKGWVGSRAHIEPSTMGWDEKENYLNPDWEEVLYDNLAYVTKEGNFEVYGVPAISGCRTGVEGFLQAAEESHGNIGEESFLIEHYKVSMRYMSWGMRVLNMYRRKAFKDKKLYPDPELWIYYGHTGTGKSRDAKAIPGRHYISCNLEGQFWFDGYDNEEVIIFDEWTDAAFSLKFLNYMMDPHTEGVRLPIKNGFVYVKPRVWVLTTNQKPQNWYKNADKEMLGAFHRRIRIQQRYLRKGDTIEVIRYDCTPGDEKFDKVEIAEIEEKSDLGGPSGVTALSIT